MYQLECAQSPTHASIWRLGNTTLVTVCRTQFGVDMDDTSSAKSDVWKHFEKSAESNKVKCSLCSKLLSYHGEQAIFQSICSLNT